MEMEVQGRNDDAAQAKMAQKDKNKETGKLKSSSHRRESSNPFGFEQENAVPP